MSATVACMIAVGVQAPPYVKVHATTHVSFADAFLAVTNIIFAYSMAPGFPESVIQNLTNSEDQLPTSRSLAFSVK